MKIAILSGSPKGDLSVTLQYINYIRINFPEHEYQVFHVAQQIKKYSEKPEAFKELISSIQKSDGIIWSTPVFFTTVPSQYKHFIELVFDGGYASAFKNKYTAVVTTSIHFFDNTSNNYLNAVCDDLEMKYTGYFSAEMYDLMHRNERNRLNLFAKNFFNAIESKMSYAKHFVQAPKNKFVYKPGKGARSIDAGLKKIVIVADVKNPKSNSWKMAEYFASCFSNPIEIISLDTVSIKGGCMGCCECGPDNNCSWGDSDDYVNFYNTTIRPANIIVFAGDIKDRWLSWKWKQFFDRSFFNTHVPVIDKRQIVWLVGGPLSYNGNIRETLQGLAENGKANIAGIISDEECDSRTLDKLIYDTASLAARYCEQDFVYPRTFLGVGGHKIFRDAVYGTLRFVFQVDHKYYKSHGFYDYPHKDSKARTRNFIIMALTKIPPFRKEFIKKLKKEMVKPLQGVLDSVKGNDFN